MNVFCLLLLESIRMKLTVKDSVVRQQLVHRLNGAREMKEKRKRSQQNDEIVCCQIFG